MLLRLHKTQYTYPTVTLNIYEALYTETNMLFTQFIPMCVYMWDGVNDKMID